MIALDTNILVYAHRVESQFHRAARAAMESLFVSGNVWAIPWPCIHEFLATVTKGRIAANPTPVPIALAQVTEFIGAPNVVLLAETRGYFMQLAGTVSAADVRGGAIHDARIAALCLSHGVQALWTADRDFRRFPTLRTRNPLPDFAP